MKQFNLFLVFILSISFSCGQELPKQQKQSNKMNIEQKSEQEWKEILTPEQYHILREKGTEKPFTGKFLNNKEKGIYICAGCGNELFTDEMKFDSHCGWVSFDREIKGKKINTHLDKSHGMLRTEITCAKCGGHLGHLFNDGITETGERYCVNSISLDFIPNPKNTINKNSIEKITLGGGCFWCVEAIFQQVKGVIKVESGYAGGDVKNPTYREVCYGKTGHAEVIQITYNSEVATLKELLEIFFSTHDPTTLNRQGNDVGTQYRSVIFYENQQQKQISEEIIKRLNEEKVFDDKIVTEIIPLNNYYQAEDYHQNYYNLNKEQPYCKIVILPKVDKFKKIFKHKTK